MPINNPQPPLKKNPLNAYARFSAMGLQMGAIIFLFVWGGQQLDQYLAVRFPVFTVVGSIMGISSALYFVIHELNKLNKK